MGEKEGDDKVGARVVFEDYFPAMVEKLGEEGFMNELCKGFEILMDSHKHLITFHSLKKNSAFLGLQFYDDDDEMLLSMLKEGDLDGDGCLDLTEFCVLMLRLSPNLINLFVPSL